MFLKDLLIWLHIIKLSQTLRCSSLSKVNRNILAEEQPGHHTITATVFGKPENGNLFTKKTRPFNHIFGQDRILRAWYRGIKIPQGRARGRKGERKTYRITRMFISIYDMMLYFCILRLYSYNYIDMSLNPLWCIYIYKSKTNPVYYALWENLVWPKEPLAQDPRKTCAREMVPGQVPPVQPGPSKGFPTKKDSS